MTQIEVCLALIKEQIEVCLALIKKQIEVCLTLIKEQIQHCTASRVIDFSLLQRRNSTYNPIMTKEGLLFDTIITVAGNAYNVSCTSYFCFQI